MLVNNKSITVDKTRAVQLNGYYPPIDTIELTELVSTLIDEQFGIVSIGASVDNVSLTFAPSCAGHIRWIEMVARTLTDESVTSDAPEAVITISKQSETNTWLHHIVIHPRHEDDIQTAINAFHVALTKMHSTAKSLAILHRGGSVHFPKFRQFVAPSDFEYKL